MKTWLKVMILTSTVSAHADDLLIQSFSETGEVMFNEVANAREYRIEWAPNADGPWSSSWNDLTGIPANGSGIVAASVPMVYRVVATVQSGAKDIFVPSDYSSIQTAIYAANLGDRIVLEPGVHTGNINLTSNITIMAQSGISATSVVVQSSSGNVFSGGWFGGVILHGFTIDGLGTARAGVYVDSTEITLDGMVVRGCQDGLAKFNWPSIHVTGCKFHNNQTGLALGYTTATLVENSMIYSNSTGITLFSWPNGTIRNCQIFNNAQNGIFLSSEFGDLTIGPNNSIFENGRYGIYHGGPNPLNAESNWWGQSPPNLADMSGHIDYVPYLTSSP